MPKKIMICDDDNGLLEMLEIVMDEFGYDVITEIDSVKVLKTVEREKPDLILLDIWMPVLTGDQVLKNIRLNPDFSQIPIIMYSASQDGADIAKKCGADDYIAKPFDMDDLELKIKEIISK